MSLPVKLTKKLATHLTGRRNNWRTEIKALQSLHARRAIRPRAASTDAVAYRSTYSCRADVSPLQWHRESFFDEVFAAFHSKN
jgi:hypothetical protein